MITVVTGATGHIGANLVRALVQRGDVVRAVVHLDTSALQGLDVELVSGDVCDPASLTRCFAGADVVYHLAGRISIVSDDAAEVEAVNYVGTHNVVRACMRGDVGRLVHFSSVHAVLDLGAAVVVDETTPLADEASQPSYDRTKARGERLVLDAVRGGLNAVVVAPTAVIGPYDWRPSHFGRVLLAMARGRLPVIMEGGFDWVDVRDVVMGAIAAAERAPSGRKYLLSGTWCSLRQMAGIVAGIMGATPPRVVVPRTVAQFCSPLAEAVCVRLKHRPLYTPYSVRAVQGHRHVSHALASEELGYAPRSLERTLDDTCGWFVEHGYLRREH